MGKIYNFSRAHWHEFLYLDYTSKFGDYNEIYNWCVSTYGEPGSDAWARWQRSRFSFRIRDKDDAMLFTLKWPKCGC